MENYIDLHMHSIYSDDGEFTPEELVEKCVAAGITIMAIADHNSVRGLAAGQAAATAKGIKFIPAVEIDCTYQGVNLHVVGYGINYHAPEFEALEQNVLNQELACSKEKIELTKKLGFEIEQLALEKLSSNGVYTGEMFGEVLLDDSRYLEHELLRPYRPGGARSDNPYVNFYWDFYAQGKPCYTKIVYPDLSEVIELVHNHGGVIVLAHPGNNLKGNYGLFEAMVQLGLDGVEAFSSYHDEAARDYFVATGSAMGLLLTCGSDFHGKTKPAIELGGCGCNKDPREIEAALVKRGLI